MSRQREKTTKLQQNTVNIKHFVCKIGIRSSLSFEWGLNRNSNKSMCIELKHTRIYSIESPGLCTLAISSIFRSHSYFVSLSDPSTTFIFLPYFHFLISRFIFFSPLAVLNPAHIAHQSWKTIFTSFAITSCMATSTRNEKWFVKVVGTFSLFVHKHTVVWCSICICVQIVADVWKEMTMAMNVCSNRSRL